MYAVCSVPTTQRRLPVLGTDAAGARRRDRRRIAHIVVSHNQPPEEPTMTHYYATADLAAQHRAELLDGARARRLRSTAAQGRRRTGWIRSVTLALAARGGSAKGQLARAGTATHATS
jgi:hypothetical protein